MLVMITHAWCQIVPCFLNRMQISESSWNRIFAFVKYVVMLASWSPVATFMSCGPLSKVYTESCKSLEASFGLLVMVGFDVSSSNASVMYTNSSCTVMLVLE